MIEKFYQHNLSWNSRISDIIGKTHSYIDPYILNRNPSLTFKEDGKINIDLMYPIELELREDSSPYFEFCECILSTFNMDEISTFCDIGCSTGHLVYNMLNYTDAYGMEYFKYQKENADDKIKERIKIIDIRDPLENKTKFDLVNCTEIAEHVDPKYLDVFLDNLKKITGKYLILTWSNTYPPYDAPPQHVSPLSIYDVKKLMNAWGFKLDEEKTNLFVKKSYSYSKFYYWWRESLMIWRVK